MRYSGIILLAVAGAFFTAPAFPAESAPANFVAEIGITASSLRHDASELTFGSARSTQIFLRYNARLDPESLQVSLGDQDISELFFAGYQHARPHFAAPFRRYE